MVDGNGEVGYYERTYRLRTKDGKYAWIYDDSGEILKDRMFDSAEEAQSWWQKEYGWMKMKVTDARQ